MNLNTNNHSSIDININISDKNVIFRTVDEKDFVVLRKSTINLYNNNVVITSENDMHSFAYLMDKYQQYDNQYGLVQSQKNKPIHLLTDEFIIVLYSPVIERLELEGQSRLKINIISDYIEPFFEPNTYIRRAKLEKIMEKLNARKKNRSNSNKRI